MTKKKSEDLIIGKTLGNRYEVIGRLKDGGMGSIYTARHCFLDTSIALKILPLYSDDVLKKRFLNEALKAISCKHDNVVGVYDYVEEKNGINFLVMEYVPGEDLNEYIERHKGKVPLNQIYDIVRQICLGLEEIHRHGIIHRDLKPENIRIQKTDKGELRAVIIDFGIAKKSTDLALTDPGIRVGTYAYMSPEQIEGVHDIDHRSDIYSLGLLIYYLMTGTPPFEEKNTQGYINAHLTKQPAPLKKIRRNLPRKFQKIISKVLAKEPDRRYASAGDLFHEIKEVIQPSRKPVYRRFVFWQAVMTILLLGCTLWFWPVFADELGYIPKETNVYTKLRAEGDSLFTLRNYSDAKEKYESALRNAVIKQDKYLVQQIWLSENMSRGVAGARDFEELALLELAKMSLYRNIGKDSAAIKTCSNWLKITDKNEEIHSELVIAESLLVNGFYTEVREIFNGFKDSHELSEKLRYGLDECGKTLISY